jgi:hypothetical protein
MIVTGWKKGNPNIKTGAGYGIRIRKGDRDKYFNKNWKSVKIEIENYQLIEVNISNSFWRDCSELRSKWFGKWMIEKKLAPWSRFKTPKLNLNPVNEKIFKLNSFRHAWKE